MPHGSLDVPAVIRDEIELGANAGQRPGEAADRKRPPLPAVDRGAMVPPKPREAARELPLELLGGLRGADLRDAAQESLSDRGVRSPGRRGNEAR